MEKQQGGKREYSLASRALIEQENAKLLAQIDQHFPPFFENLRQSISTTNPYKIIGRVTKVVGTVIFVTVTKVRIGEIVRLYSPQTEHELMCEVVGFQNKEAILSPIGEMLGLSAKTEVYPTGRVQDVSVGQGLLGRVIDGLGNFIDGKDEGFVPETTYPVYCDPPPPMTRQVIQKALPMGVRAIDGMLTVGEGQRIGVFAAAGGGKSTLMAMLVKGTAADVIVVALIGERGREVREFIEHELGPEGMAKSVLVVATSDKSSMERTKAAYVATAVAEYFRDQGQKVLFLMDSVTRFARAQREIGLAAGEPPTRRGFPPSVFANLPKLMERVGMNHKSSITALYTVLVEGDDLNEPVADETRSILDGHFNLSSKLAASNHYPAIDILTSKSRLMNVITDQKQQNAAGEINKLLAAYAEAELLIQIGEYQQGSDPLVDMAIAKRGLINQFLQQKTDEISPFDTTIEQLMALTT